MFSVVNSVLLRPLPGYETDRLMQICDNRTGPATFIAPRVYLRLRERLHSFAPVAANQYCRMNLTGARRTRTAPRPVHDRQLVRVAAGASDARPHLPARRGPARAQPRRRPRSRILAAAFRRRPEDPRQTLTLDQEPWLVVGVMPRSSGRMDRTTPPIYTPYVVADNPHGLNVTGRLKPGVSPGSRASGAQRRMPANSPARIADWKDLKLLASPVLEQMTGPQRPLLLLLLGRRLVRAADRLRERGEPAARPLRAPAARDRHSVSARRDADPHRSFPSGRNAAILTVGQYSPHRRSPTAACEVCSRSQQRCPAPTSWPSMGECSLVRSSSAPPPPSLFGFLPALRATATGNGAIAGIPDRGEVALAFVLLMGAGLLIRTFVAIRTTDLGYNPQNVLAEFRGTAAFARRNRTAGRGTYARIRDRCRRASGSPFESPPRAAFPVLVSPPLCRCSAKDNRSAMTVRLRHWW